MELVLFLIRVPVQAGFDFCNFNNTDTIFLFDIVHVVFVQRRPHWHSKGRAGGLGGGLLGGGLGGGLGDGFGGHLGALDGGKGSHPIWSWNHNRYG